ncbi:MAG: hypothetical protein WCB27_15905 [Thermoguttaceae bacterium]
MSSVSDIQQAVQALPEEEFAVFSSWFEQYEEERWDRQMERDQSSGPLRSLMEKARADFEAGKCSPLCKAH